VDEHAALDRSPAPVVVEPGRASSPERFESFYLREFRKVVALTYALSGSGLAAEDLAQEAFLAASQRWEVIGRYERPEAWVRRVAANMARRTVRRRFTEARVLARAALGRGGQPGQVRELPDDAAGVWQAVRRLPRRQAQVVVLYYLAGETVAEVAATLGLAEGTVKAHLSRARRALSEQLAVNLEDSP
jgi:RNA polymerase sigma factor (sigma-70 family)